MPEMTELERGEIIREWITLLQTQGILVNGETTTMMTLLFGYLLLAYFVGKSLSNTQSMIVTGLYIVAFVITLGNIVTGVLASAAMAAPFKDLCPECTLNPMSSPAGAVLVLLINLAMLIASLYFMWSVRKRHAN